MFHRPSTPKGAELHAQYDVANDAYIFWVPHGITPAQMQAIADWLYPRKKAEWLGARGDKRELIGKELRALENKRFVQRVHGQGDHVFFKATQGTGKIFSFGGN